MAFTSRSWTHVGRLSGGVVRIVFPCLMFVGQVVAQNLLPAQPALEPSLLGPYAFGGLSLSQGSGYAPAAGEAGVGLNIERNHLITFTEFSADNAHKEDLGTGHDLYFQARTFYRARRSWYFGGGAQWNKLVTDPYSKQSWHPAFGGGRDLFRENLSMRAQLLYILPGTDHWNAVQGPEIALWLPSPASQSHFFYRQTIGLYEFHQTSVPGNPGTAVRNAAVFLNCGAIYRF
ncbi:MAG TPA: hypothetical protein VEF05_08195 [Terriglobales bacterium]|nr:hypothetical protein [Terriglobales bacterium]